MIKGEGSAVVPGVTAQEVFDFVLDPAQYTKADTKIMSVTQLAPTENGMIAREDGRFLGRFPGSVITRYRWDPPRRIDVSLEHGVPQAMDAWFEIEDREGGAWLHHVETIEMPQPFTRLFDLAAGRWLAESVRKEVDELRRLLVAGERGRGLAAH